LVEGALRYPWVWLTAGRTATAVWIPPDGTDLSDAQEDLVEPTVIEMLGADAPRVMRASRCSTGLTPERFRTTS